MSQAQSNPLSSIAVKPYINPLGPEHEAALNEFLTNAHMVEDFINRCEACHLDVKQHREQHQAFHAVATAIKAKFFPDNLPDDL